ncbi:MAG TPA: rhomboid family intramembrane serine protease, partial [Polyangia bacterium]
IWGLMTAGVALAIRPRGLFPPRALRRMFKLAVWPVVINFFYSFSPGIDLYAHFGGGLVGFALMLSGALTIGVQPTWDGAPRAPERRRPVLTLAAATLAIAMLASVALALATGRPWALGDPPRLRPVVVGDSGVSLSLPEAIALPPKIETRPNGVRLFDFITIGEPLGVEVVIAPIGPGGDPAATLEAERQTLDRVSPPKATREGAATLVTVGARRFAFVRYRMRGATMQTWVTVLNDQEVVLRVYQYGAVPPSWSGAARQIVASLR